MGQEALLAVQVRHCHPVDSDVLSLRSNQGKSCREAAGDFQLVSSSIRLYKARKVRLKNASGTSFQRHFSIPTLFSLKIKRTQVLVVALNSYFSRVQTGTKKFIFLLMVCKKRRQEEWETFSGETEQ